VIGRIPISHPNFTQVGLQQAIEQFDQSGFSGSVLPDDGDTLPGGDFHVDLIQCPDAAQVGKGYIIDEYVHLRKSTA
jgi:hypothetical protein